MLEFKASSKRDIPEKNKRRQNLLEHFLQVKQTIKDLADLSQMKLLFKIFKLYQHIKLTISL